MEKIDVEKINDCINQMNSISNNIENNFNTIKSLTKGVSNSWSGTASAEYINKTRKLTSEFDDYIAELKKCKTFLSSVVAAYNDLESNLLFKK